MSDNLFCGQTWAMGGKARDDQILLVPPTGAGEGPREQPLDELSAAARADGLVMR